MNQPDAFKNKVSDADELLLDGKAFLKMEAIMENMLLTDNVKPRARLLMLNGAWNRGRL